MLQFTTGNMFDTPADIRVNTVNCVGVMGAGVALAFKQRYPEMYRDYKRECDAGEVRPGNLHVWKNLSGDWIINFPTKRHWRENSKYEDIESGLVALREYLEPLRNVRVTLPALGSGHGRLDWTRVSEMIRKHLGGLEAEIIVFDPADSRMIDETQPSNSSEKLGIIEKGSPDFPEALTDSKLPQIYYQGDLDIFHQAKVTIGLSAKPSEREKEAAIESIGELPKTGVAISVVLGSAAATKLAETALDRGMWVIAWVPQGLSRFRLPKTLGYRAKYLLLLSLAKPQQAWNPGLAQQTNLASLITSQATLVTDPEPSWSNTLQRISHHNLDTHFFYLRYRDFINHPKGLVERVPARPIGRRSIDGKPNLVPILNALGIVSSPDSS